MARKAVRALSGSTRPFTRIAIAAADSAVDHRGIKMNWDRVEGNWKQIKGSIKEQWGKLTDDELDVIAGKRDRLVGKIQETYGISRDEVEIQLAAWHQKQKDKS
jgi:uncharacterized protein YjbJ (UPF0337 family)